MYSFYARSGHALSTRLHGENRSGSAENVSSVLDILSWRIRARKCADSSSGASTNFVILLVGVLDD